MDYRTEREKEKDVMHYINNGCGGASGSIGNGGSARIMSLEEMRYNQRRYRNMLEFVSYSTRNLNR